MGKIIFVFLFVLSILGCGTQNETASDVNGSSSTAKRWSKSNFPLKIYVPKTMSDEYKSAIEASISDWNTALNTTALVAVYDTGMENTQWASYNDSTNDTLMGLYSIIKTVWDTYKLSSGTIAVTTSKYYPSSGEMLTADVLFNENFKFYDYRSGYLCRSASLISDETKCSENKSCKWQESETNGSCANIYPIASTTCSAVTTKSVCVANYGCGWTSAGNECGVDTSKQTSTIDYRTALTHELGHFLGLAHTDTSKCTQLKNENECSTNDSCTWDESSCIGDTLSIMAPSISKGEVKQLSSGDVNRVQNLYNIR